MKHINLRKFFARFTRQGSIKNVHDLNSQSQILCITDENLMPTQKRRVAQSNKELFLVALGLGDSDTH